MTTLKSDTPEIPGISPKDAKTLREAVVPVMNAAIANFFAAEPERVLPIDYEDAFLLAHKIREAIDHYVNSKLNSCRVLPHVQVIDHGPHTFILSQLHPDYVGVVPATVVTRPLLSHRLIGRVLTESGVAATIVVGHSITD